MGYFKLDSKLFFPFFIDADESSKRYEKIKNVIGNKIAAASRAFIRQWDFEK